MNNGTIERNSRYNKPLKIVDKQFTRGIAAHATSKIVVQLPGPGKKFISQIGLDNNEQTASGQGTVVFSVSVAGRNVFRSEVLQSQHPGQADRGRSGGATQFALEVGDAGDGIGWDQADWADARSNSPTARPFGSAICPSSKTKMACSRPTRPSPSPTTASHPPSSSQPGKSIASRRNLTTIARPTPSSIPIPPAGSRSAAKPSRTTIIPPSNGRSTLRTPARPTRRSSRTSNRSTFAGSAAPISEFLLHHNIGAPADNTDYTPLESVLGGNSTKRIGAAGGRSTCSNLSYFNLERSKNDGLIIVVGWPGQWAADFIRDADRGLQIRAGQELTHFKLHPGEEVRTPLSVLQFWKGGDWLRAQNIWRRWMIAHNIPRPDGKPPEAHAGSLSRRCLRGDVQVERGNPFLLVQPLSRREDQARLLVDGRRLVQVRSGRLAARWARGRSTKAVPATA